ncbi:hypothetical protein N789_03615 [Arenimonas oryziterrae DSM 21050 = YC6267]|uniref:Uncharacterized protein n=1 Tax=Arenimonas oryziterrae DSM 21050 = YC6267 TaxID=1121015 RepID=A0A091BBP5_9GAMM|nr:hypothetical protein N789_03615 [Arenimonas oryziterrae DSM 21050 = YC6267]
MLIRRMMVYNFFVTFFTRDDLSVSLGIHHGHSCCMNIGCI